MDINLTFCSAEKFKDIEDLAYYIWPYAYCEILSDEQIQYMLNKMYSAESLLSQYNAGAQFYFIERNKEVLGFLSFTDRGGDYYINKFYLLPQLVGQNIGAHTYEKLLELLSPKKPIRLNVNRYNIKAINFYFKIGFKIESFEDIKIGAGFEMNDFVMHTNPERLIKKSYP